MFGKDIAPQASLVISRDESFTREIRQTDVIGAEASELQILAGESHQAIL